VTPLAPELLALCAPCTGCTADPKQHLDGPFVDACLAFEREQSQRFERVYHAIEQLEQDNAALKLIIYRLKAAPRRRSA
jgi:hypothetical protein